MLERSKYAKDQYVVRKSYMYVISYVANKITLKMLGLYLYTLIIGH